MSPYTYTCTHTVTLTGFAVLLVRAAVAAVAEEVTLQLQRDAALVAAGELRLPAGPRPPSYHLCRSRVRVNRQLRGSMMVLRQLEFFFV